MIFEHAHMILHKKHNPTQHHSKNGGFGKPKAIEEKTSTNMQRKIKKAFETKPYRCLLLA